MEEKSSKKKETKEDLLKQNIMNNNYLGSKASSQCKIRQALKEGLHKNPDVYKDSFKKVLEHKEYNDKNKTNIVRKRSKNPSKKRRTQKGGK